MNLQRNIPPDIRPIELKKLPDAELYTLKSGVPVYFIEAGSEELMRVEFIFDAGQIRENFPLVASTTNSMLLEGSVNYSAKEINSLFDFYGAFVNMAIHKDSAGATVFFLNKHIDKILELCYEFLFRPSFNEYELNNLQKKRLQSFLMNREKVQTLASDKYFEAVFGPSHHYGKQVFPEDFENVTPSMMRSFHDENYCHGKMTIIVSGKIHKEAKEILNRYFGAHDFGKSRKLTNNIPIKGSRIKKEFIEKKGALQSAIRIGSATINKRHRDYNKLMVLDTILGGYFGSRLMKNIREEKGYTYGINSSLVSMDQSGYNVILTEVGKKYTKKTVEEIYKEIRRLQTQSVEKNEMDVVRSFMAGEMVRMFDGPFALAESFRAALDYGLDNNYYYNLAETIKTIDPDEITELAVTYYNIDDLYEIIAGPK